MMTGYWNQMGLLESSVKQKSSRRGLDLYETEGALTAVLINSIPQICGTILEPCAGTGKMATAIKNQTNQSVVLTNDINSEYESDFIGDAGDPHSACWQRPYDWIVTNPPFSDAHRILPIAFISARVGVAFLLRLTYAEPAQNGQARGQWLHDHADHQIWQCTVNPRPRFRAGETNPKTGKEFGTDSTTVAWFVWHKDWSWKQSGIMSPFGYAMNWSK